MHKKNIWHKNFYNLFDSVYILNENFLLKPLYQRHLLQIL